MNEKDFSIIGKVVVAVLLISSIGGLIVCNFFKELESIALFWNSIIVLSVIAIATIADWLYWNK